MARQSQARTARLSEIRLDPPPPVTAALSDARDPQPTPPMPPARDPVTSRFGRMTPAPASTAPETPRAAAGPSSRPTAKTAWDVFRELADRTLRDSSRHRPTAPSLMASHQRPRPVMRVTDDPGRQFFEEARAAQRRPADLAAWQHRLRSSLIGSAAVGAVRGVAGIAEGVAGVLHWSGLLSEAQLANVQRVAETPLLNPAVATAQVLDNPKGTLGNPHWWAFQGGQAAASVLALMSAGGPAQVVLAKLMKAPGTVGLAAAAVAGAVESLVEGGSVYADAKRHGASDEVAGRAATEVVAANIPFLAVTNLPLFNPRSARRALNAITAGSVQAAQESGQQLASTVAARHYTERPLGTGVVESAVVGGLTGVVFGAAGSPRRPRPVTPSPLTPDPSAPPSSPVAMRAQQVIELLAEREALVAQQASAADQAAHAAALADVDRRLQTLIGAPATAAPTPAPAPGHAPATAIPVERATEVQPGGYYRLPPSEIAVDVDRFQFKSGVTAEGITPEARIEGPWNANRAGILLAWQDPETQRLYVVNGHHRVEAARRLGAPEVVVRVLEPMSPQAARVEGALTNIAEDQGTAIDAAHVLRGGGYTSADLRAAGLTLGRGLARRGWALAQLADPVFHRVATGDLKEALGVRIGEAGLSPEAQAAVVSLVDRQRARGRTITPGQLTALIEDVLASSSVQVTSDQGNLFTDVLGEERLQNVALEKAVLRDWLLGQLGKDRRLVGYVAAADRAEALARGGNVINRTASAEIANQARRAQLVVERLASRAGPVNAALTRAAERVLAGEAASTVRADLLADVRTQVESLLRGSPAEATSDMAPAAPAEAAPDMARSAPTTPAEAATDAATRPAAEVTASTAAVTASLDDARTPAAEMTEARASTETPGRTVVHFTTPEAAARLLAGEPYQHVEAHRNLYAPVAGRPAPPPFYPPGTIFFSLDDATWGHRTVRTGQGERVRVSTLSDAEVEALRARARDRGDVVAAFNYDTQEYEFEVGGVRREPLTPVPATLDPKARTLVVDGPEGFRRLKEIASSVRAALDPRRDFYSQPAFWQAVARHYDVIEIRNVPVLGDRDGPRRDELARAGASWRFWDQFTADQIMVLNPQVVSFGHATPTDTGTATSASGARLAPTDRLRPGSPIAAGISGRRGPPDGSASRLPDPLRQAVPRLRSGRRHLSLVFERDLDLALYMIGRAKSAAQAADYLTFVQEVTGMDATVARNLGRATVARVKALAEAHTQADHADEVLRVPNDGRGPVPDRSYLREAPDAEPSEDRQVVDVLSTGDQQPRLPGDVGAWRDVDLELPPIAPIPGREPEPPVVGSTVVVRPGWQRSGVTIRAGDTALVMDVRPWQGVPSVYVQPEGVDAPFPVFLWEFDRLFQRQPTDAPGPQTPEVVSASPASEAVSPQRPSRTTRASQARVWLPAQTVAVGRSYDPPSATAPSLGRPISELETLERIRQVWSVPRGSGGTAPLPVRTGRVRSAGAMGVYLAHEGLIRLRSAGDLKTFIHELGHHLDLQWITRRVAHLPLSSYAHELLTLGAATSPANASLWYQMAEGTAEYFRLWFADPVAAGLAAPQWTQVLAEVRQADPAFNLRLQRTRELVQRFITQSTLVRARAQTDIQPVGLKRRLAAVVSELRATRDWTQSLPARVVDALRWTRQWPWTEMGGVRGVRDAIIEGWFDAEREAVKAVADIAVARGGPLRPTERVDLLIKHARRAESIAETMLSDGVIDQAGRFRGPSLKAALRPIADLLEAGPEETNFPNLLHALRAQAIYRQAAETARQALDPGLSQEQADLVVAEALQHPRGRDLVRAAKAVDAHERAVRRWIFEHGGIPRELFDALNASPFYVPLQRVMDAIATSASSPRGQPIRRRVGSARPVKNPIENIVRNLTPAIHWTLENRAVGTLVSQVLQTPSLAHLLVEIDPPRVPQVINLDSVKDAITDLLQAEGVSVPPSLDLDAMVTVWMPATLQVGRQQIVSWLDGGPHGSGRRRFFQVQDEALFRWLQSLGAERTRLALGLVTKPLERVATMLRDGAVQTMEFVALNLWRDTLGALLQSRHGFIPFYDTLRGMSSILRRDAYYRHIVLSSGRFSTISTADRPHIERWITRHLRSPVVPGLKILRWANPFELMDQIGQVMELSARVGEGRLAIEQRGMQRRVGLIGIAQRLRDAVTGVVPQAPSGWTEEDILLAAVQDAQTVTLPFREGGTYARIVNRYTPFFNAMLLGFRESWRAARRDPLGTALTVAALLAVKLALWWANREDEQFQSLRPEQRRSHFWVRAGDAWLTIPVPSGPLGFVLGLGDLVLEAAYREGDDQTKAELASAAQTSHWALTSVLPVVGRVWAEIAANYDLYRDRPIIALDDVRKQPDLQIDPWTSETARAAGAVLGMAPGTIEHLGYALQSNRWRLMTTWLDPWARKVTELATGRPLPPAPAVEFERSRLAVTTGLSRLIRSGLWMTGADPVDRFYRRFAELEGDLGSYRAYRKGYGLIDPAPYKAALLAKYTPDEIRRMRLAKVQIDALRQQRDRVWLSHTLSSHQKQAALHQISRQIARWASWAIDAPARPPRKE